MPNAPRATLKLIHHLPNVLTILRIAAAFGIVGTLGVGDGLAYGLALGLFLFASVSDYLDGYFARRLSAQSQMGAVLDPLADKAVTFASFCVLVSWSVYGQWHLIAVGAIVIREIGISALRFGSPHNALSVSRLAKAKTTIQFIAIALALSSAVWPNSAALLAIALGALWLAAALTVFTGAQYILKLNRVETKTKTR